MFASLQLHLIWIAETLRIETSGCYRLIRTNSAEETTMILGASHEQTA
jgi:hypothetical protein